ncbi:MAG: hypothetical protein LBH17_02090 [Oscillospiraceae bacterium]|jgi:predicted tellurium resistance membrane protein TerC|nr:hypothetical protein [Oscillospiraceae bacterium]
MKRGIGQTIGAVIMCIGILLLGSTVLPAVCWLFIIGLIMVLKGYSMMREMKRKF